MSQALQVPHSVLNYLLTKAAVSGKVAKTTLRVPYADLVASVGKSTTKEADLVITIEMSWDEKVSED